MSTKLKTQNANVRTRKAESLDETRTLGRAKAFESTTVPLLLYWLFCAAVSFLLLRDDIFSWRVGEAWRNNWFWGIFALVVTVAAQIGYMRVARSDGRPFSPSVSLVIVAVNGVLECFVFLSFYNLFFEAAKLLFGNLNFINFFFGFVGFVIYSGLAHGLFWARLIPPHFSAEPKLQRLRKLLTPIQAAIVLAWCIYFYFTRDIWTLVAYHIIIDVVLMTWVRPPVLWAKNQYKAPSL